MTELRRRTQTLAGTALVGLSLAMAPALAGADRAEAARVQRAQSGGVYFMPSGDHVVGTVVRKGYSPTRRSPTPDAELVRLKRSRGSAGPADAADATVDGGESARRAVLTNCATNIATGSAPSDIHGAAGPTNLVVVTNVDIGIYNKGTCAIVSRVALRTFFAGFGIPAQESLFDPRVLYDRLSGRCLVLAESRNSGNSDQFLYVAGSTNNNCTSYNLRRFTLSQGAGFFCKASVSDFYDYPNAGYNLRRLVVTSNNFPTSSAPYGTILSIDKNALYANGAVNGSCFIVTNTNLAPAVVGDNNASMFILSPGSGGGNSLSRRRLDTAAAGPGSDTLAVLANISIPAWTAPPDAVQPNGQRIDSLDGRFQSATKQIRTSLWNVHAVNLGGVSRAKMYKLSTSGNSVVFSRTISTTACARRAPQHTFNPSIDTNSAARGSNAFVTLSRTCPSSGAVGRAAHIIHKGSNSSNTGWVFNTVATSAAEFATDGFGTACNATARGSCRWGDYSSTQIDPSNTARAWGFNQLVSGTTQFNWITRGGLVN